MTTVKPAMQAPGAVVPVTDPLKVEEVYATEVMLNIRDGVVHRTFVLNRPVGFTSDGKVIEERIVVGRVVTSLASAQSELVCVQQSIQTIATQEKLRVN